MRMTYDQMTAALAVDRCRGITHTGHYCTEQHDKEGSITDSTIHFGSRPVTKAGTLAFLRLVARAQDPSIDEDVPWRRVYRLNMAVRDLAASLRMKDPGHPASLDRAFVLASVAGVPNSEPMRKRAYDWARRRGGRTI